VQSRGDACGAVIEAKETTVLTIKKAGNLKYVFTNTDVFIAEIAAGESIIVECEIAYRMERIEATLSGPTPGVLDFPYLNPSTGPLRIRGSMAGQMLAVHIERIDLADVGYMAVLPNSGLFPDWIWKRPRELIRTRPMKVSNGVIHWDDNRKLPVSPMVGVIGVAPILGGVLALDNGTHGGNIDVQELGPGATVYLPIEHDGGFLYLGDCHACQGDGEPSGMAFEIDATVTLSVDIADRPKRMTWPRFETRTHIGTIGCARPLEDAMRISYEQMLYWLVDEYGFPELEAYMLLGAIGEARCTQMGNPKFTYICKVQKSLIV
jgi:amidase